MKSPILVLLIFIAANTFAQLPKDVNFIGLSTNKKVPDSLFVSPDDKDSLAKFFKVYEAHSLPVMIKGGQPGVGLSCNEVFAICLNPKNHLKIVMRTKLLNHKEVREFTIKVDSLYKLKLDKKEGTRFKAFESKE